MAKNNNTKQQRNFDRGAATGQLQTMFESFLKTATEYDIKALNTFLANKINGDRETKAGTIVVVAKTMNVRGIARSIGFMDAVLHEGKSAFGNPGKGDIETYAKNLAGVISSYSQVFELINETTQDAIKKNIGPAWAIKNHLIDTIHETYKTSRAQAEKLHDQYNKARRDNQDLDLKTFMKTYEDDAKKAGLELKEFLIKQAAEKQAGEQASQKAKEAPKPENKKEKEKKQQAAKPSQVETTSEAGASAQASA